MRKVLGLLLTFVAITGQANHIVGGEIEFIHLRNNEYRIQIVQYFDDANPINPGPEATATVRIFRNGDNSLVSQHLLFFESREIIPYTNPECAIDELRTSRVIWATNLILNPDNYSDPAGYYIVWERCCRNANLVNVVNPLGTGMKYTLEFPPLIRNDQRFFNSSPVLFRPLSDYACINQLYYTEFTGTDPDGDSLVYSLALPLNSSAAVAVPIPQPKPHPTVIFADPFSTTNQIPGDPSLSISSRGLLTVTPTQEGLFVFSVLVEEFRNGEKIGEVQRDFQMLVISEGCNPPDPPVVGASIPGNPSFQPSVDTLKYAVGDRKCFDFLVTNLTDGETISLRAEAVNFEGEVGDIFSIDQQFINEETDTLQLEVCVSDCPLVSEGPYIIDLIAGDDACPLPQLDTLRLSILVEPPPNAFPVISPGDQTVFLDEDDFYTLDFTGTDADGDSLFLDLYVAGVADPSQIGIQVETLSTADGEISGRFIWDTDCSLYDFSEEQVFRAAVLVEDADTCMRPNPDSLWFDLNVLLPPNTEPVVALDGAFAGRTDVEVKPSGELTFEVEVADADNDTVNLRMLAPDFDPGAYGMQFLPSEGIGSTSSVFTWPLDCPFFDTTRSEFRLLFIGDDRDKCKTQNSDTLEFVINIDFFNNPPEMEPVGPFRLEVNDPFEVELVASDLDAADNVTIDFFDGFRLPSSPSLSFDRAQGRGTVSSTLSWVPECTLLDGEDQAFYELVFIGFDDACPDRSFDSTTVVFEIINPQPAGVFMPPNVFTPNGDGKNDVFRLTGLREPTANLPPDNCDDQFDFITIHDRSGKSVFESDNREFQWTGGDNPTGVYYYVVHFEKTEFKGFVQLLK
ncbi:MAG: gliding motility-associated C-terminal domain-containing protein [Bacteroidota bacterium]